MSIRLCQSCAPSRTMIETAQAPNELLGVRFSTVPRVWSRLPVARPQEPVTRPQLPSPWGRLNAAPHPDFLLVLPLDESGAYCLAAPPNDACQVCPLVQTRCSAPFRLRHERAAVLRWFDPPLAPRSVTVSISTVAFADVPAWVVRELRSSCSVSSCACKGRRGRALCVRPVLLCRPTCAINSVVTVASKYVCSISISDVESHLTPPSAW